MAVIMPPSRSCHEWQECHLYVDFLPTCAATHVPCVPSGRADRRRDRPGRRRAVRARLAGRGLGRAGAPRGRQARLRLPGLHAAAGPGQGPLRLRPVRRARPRGDRGRRPGLPRAARTTSSTTTRPCSRRSGGRRPRRDPLRALLGAPSSSARPGCSTAASARRTGATPTSSSEMYPEAKVRPDVLYCHDGNILTGAGSAAGIDASLHLMRDLFGARRGRDRRPADRRTPAPRRRPGPVHRARRPRLRRRDARAAAAVDHREPRRGPRRRHPGPQVADVAAHLRPPVPRRDRHHPALLGHPAAGAGAPRSCSSRPTTRSTGSPTRSASATPPTLRHHFTRVARGQPAAVPPHLRRPHRLLGGSGQLAPAQQGGVPAAAGDQLVVGAELDDAAAVEDGDLVGVAHVDSRWAMVIVVRPRASVVERGLDGPLGLVVERAGRLVEHQHRAGRAAGCGRSRAAASRRRRTGARGRRPRCRSRRAGRRSGRGSGRPRQAVLDLGVGRVRAGRAAGCRGSMACSR